MLHPGEVLYRLQHDLPLILDEEANWNNRVKQTADYYLKEYMAKNLYFLETKVRIKSDKQKNVAKLLADRRFRKMA